MEFEETWTQKVMHGLGAITVMALFAGLLFYSWEHFKPVKYEPQIKWIEQPFSIEKDAKGNPIATIVLGLDDKGFLRWGRGAPPAQQPTPALPMQTISPAKPKP